MVVLHTLPTTAPAHPPRFPCDAGGGWEGLGPSPFLAAAAVASDRVVVCVCVCGYVWCMCRYWGIGGLEGWSARVWTSKL